MNAMMPMTPCAFAPDSLRDLDALYPVSPGRLSHQLHDHALLSLDALAALGEALEPSRVEYNRAKLPIGIAPEDIPANGLGIGETIRTIDSNESWAVLKNIETVPAYRYLLIDLLRQLDSVVVPKTGPMLTPQGFIFVSSPGSMTPLHFDPEHNILMQLRGTKVMNVLPASDERFAPLADHERYHSGGHRNLAWHDNFAAAVTPVALAPGDAVHMPVMAPHYVQNGDAVSISLSITWRSEWSYREAEAHAANRWLRRFGISGAMPPRWPRHAVLRSLLWRGLRRFPALAKL